MSKIKYTENDFKLVEEMIRYHSKLCFDGLSLSFVDWVLINNNKKHVDITIAVDTVRRNYATTKGK